jgi:hypothetical protein
MASNWDIYRLAQNVSGPIKLSEAADELGYDSSRGVAKRISAAWDYFDSNGYHQEAAEIARTFVDRNYRFAWD